jgi:hypothetical protein
MMSKSNIERAKENAAKLRKYINENDKFPMHRGRLNKTKLLKELNIGLAARQNIDIKDQLDELELKITNNRKTFSDTSENSETVKRLRNYINGLNQKLAIAEARLDDYKRADFSESLLIKTGKLIKQPRTAPINFEGK